VLREEPVMASQVQHSILVFSVEFVFPLAGFMGLLNDSGCGSGARMGLMISLPDWY